jgi:TRAP-type C4-dicarboxylate transport system permease large subunit
LLVPVFLTALIANDINLIWFGILVVLVSEIGLITPPIGMNVFVVKSVLQDVRLGAIFRGVVPYIVALLIGLALVLTFPSIATFLPNLMR